MKKNAFLKIRISKEDYETVKQEAADTGVTLSEFVRSRIFATVKIPVKGIIKDGKIIMEEK